MILILRFSENQNYNKSNKIRQLLPTVCHNIEMFFAQKLNFKYYYAFKIHKMIFFDTNIKKKEI
jgi:hypothetical protein